MPPPPAAILVLLRRAPALSPSELALVFDLAARARQRRWAGGRAPEIHAFEGAGDLRAGLRLELVGAALPVPDQIALVELLDELASGLPGVAVEGRDPLAILGLRDGRFELCGPRPLPLAALERLPCEAILRPPGSDPVDEVLAPPVTEGELADLLHLLEACPDAGAALAAGRRAAARHATWLREALFSGRLPAAAATLLVPLARQGEVDAEAIVEGLRALRGDGDQRERTRAQDLLALLQPEPADDPAAWASLPALGAALLAPPLTPAAYEDASEWTDDLELDEGEVDPGEDEPGGADGGSLPGGVGYDRLLAQRLEELAFDPRIDALAACAHHPTFSARALARLHADDASAAAASLLIATRRWPLGRLPGWSVALPALACSAQRPVSVRAMGLLALGRAPGEAALRILVEHLNVAHPALRCAAALALRDRPEAAAREALHQALAAEGTRALALRVLGPLGDPRARELAARWLVEQPRVLDDEDHRGAILQALATDPDHHGEALDALLAPSRPVELQGAAAAALVEAAGLDPKASERLASWAHRAPIPALLPFVEALGRHFVPSLHAALLHLAGHRAPVVRAAVATALGRWGLASSTPILLRMLLDPAGSVGMRALEALQHAGDARAVKVLRLLTQHPGPPGSAAEAVLGRGRRLRQAPPDDRIRLLARHPRPLPHVQRARLSEPLRALGLRIEPHDRGFSAEGRIDPDDLGALERLRRALAAIDQELSGLRWSARESQGLLRREGGQWLLDTQRGEPAREAGWFREELPSLARPPLRAPPRRTSLDPGLVEALPVGTAAAAREPLPSLDDEEVEDEATEQSISDFLEEATMDGRAGAASGSRRGGAPRTEPPPTPPARSRPPSGTGRRR